MFIIKTGEVGYLVISPYNNVETVALFETRVEANKVLYKALDRFPNAQVVEVEVKIK